MSGEYIPNGERFTPLAIISKTIRSESQARAILEALREAGYACVPREPTQNMIEEGWYYAHEEDAAGTWRAMIAVGDTKITNSG